MHCTSTYPTPYEHVQLGCIAAAAGDSTACRSASPITRWAARWRSPRSRAARTCSRSTSRRRGRCPARISRARWSRRSSQALVKDIRAIEQARGATKKIQPGEQDVRNMALHSVVSIRDIAAGAHDRRGRRLGEASGHRHSRAAAGRVIGSTAKRAIDERHARPSGRSRIGEHFS